MFKSIIVAAVLLTATSAQAKANVPAREQMVLITEYAYLGGVCGHLGSSASQLHIQAAIEAFSSFDADTPEAKQARDLLRQHLDKAYLAGVRSEARKAATVQSCKSAMDGVAADVNRMLSATR